jgi:hypothetical protein
LLLLNSGVGGHATSVKSVNTLVDDGLANQLYRPNPLRNSPARILLLVNFGNSSRWRDLGLFKYVAYREANRYNFGGVSFLSSRI